MINPHAMKHLLLIAGMRDPGNLFAILEGCAPELRNLCDSFGPAHGTVCEGHRIAVDMIRGREGLEPKTLACTIVRLAADRAIATFTDITVQVQQERRLKETETWFASLLNGVNDYAVLSITAAGLIDAVDDSFTRQTGHSSDAVTGRSLDVILAADPASGSLSLLDQLQIAARDGWYLDENWMSRSDGERYWCQRLFAARMAADGLSLAGFSVVLRDVEPQQADTALLRRLLTQDHLTGAANRSHFLDTFEREQRRWHEHFRPMALIMLDLDHFKAVNDVYGHPIGDMVLTQLSAACIALLRPTDLFTRLGGEEFAALLPATTLAEAVAIAETLRAAIGAIEIPTPSGPLKVTASFGVAEARDADMTIQALLALADERLYAAKHAGRDRVFGEAA